MRISALRGKVAQNRLGLRVAEIEGHAPLVAIERHEIGAVAGDLRRKRPRVVAAARSLDLHDIGAEIAEQHAAMRAGNEPGEIEYLDAAECSDHGLSNPQKNV